MSGELETAQAVAAAYWAGFRAQAAFVGSWAWNIVDDAVTSWDDGSIPLLIALSEQVQSDQELAWLVSEPLDDLLGQAPHKTPQMIVEAAQNSPPLAKALRAMDVRRLPMKAQIVLREAGYAEG